MKNDTTHTRILSGAKEAEGCEEGGNLFRKVWFLYHETGEKKLTIPNLELSRIAPERIE